MNRNHFLAGCFYVVLAVFPGAGFAQSAVKTIEIAPVWNGSEQPPSSIIEIRNTPQGFERIWDPSALAQANNILQIFSSPSDSALVPRTPTYSQDSVSKAAIIALVAAMKSPRVAKPDSLNLGISSAWLRKHASDVASNMGSLGAPNDARQQEFFRTSFTNLNLIETLLPKIVADRWTDDPVWVRVRIRFLDGTAWIAETRNQPPFMLPWIVHRNGRTFQTFNADISRAAAELMPDGTVNKKRLEGAGLDRLITQAMEPVVGAKWQELGAEDNTGDALSALRHRYSIRRAEFSYHIGVFYGPDVYDSSHSQPFLEADVHRQDFPSNLVIASVFPVENQKAAGIEDFLRKGSKYESVILTNPWLMASLKMHGNLGAWLAFVKDTSMSDKAMRIFSSDMHGLGRDDLSEEVSDHRSEVALLNYDGNYLIVFPDHHAIVWRWGQLIDLFGWPASTLKTERCSQYPTTTEGCVAAQIDPSGHLVR